MVEKIIDTVNLLRSDIFPKPSLNCEYCNYLKALAVIKKYTSKKIM